MANNLKFNNVILMLKEEDRGFGGDKPPAGYIRLEVRDGKGKITAMVQNLKDSDEYNNYKLYLIKYHEGEIYPALMGIIPVKNGRGEITREINPLNVEDTKLHADDFNIGVVVLEHKSTGRTYIKCPLASYKGKKVKWIESFENYLKDSKIARKIKYEEEIKKKATENFRTKYDEEVKKEAERETDKADEIEVEAKVDVKINGKIRENTEYNETNRIEEENQENRMSEDAEEDIGGIREAEIDSVKMVQDVCGDIYSKYTGAVESKYSFTENIPEKNPDVMCTNHVRQYKNIMNGSTNKKDENKEIRKQIEEIESKEKAEQVKENQETANLETIYRETANQETGVEKTLPDIKLLGDCLDKVFKRCDPFNTRRRDYKWWKIHNPVYLNNVLQYCNIHIPRIFNPSIIMAYYKYRYLIAGIYTSRKRGKEYIVYGIPGTYNIDESPLGDLCRWIQIEGNTPKYGAFGYWIAYIDPDTGELLKVG